MKIEKKVALVIGASREGIGTAYCRALLNKGAKVFFADIRNEEGKATERILQEEYGKDNVRFVKCDVTKQHDVEHLFKEVHGSNGRIDIVNYNAGIINEFDFRGPIEVNVCGLMTCTNTALQYMGKDRGGNGGVMVNTASLASLYPYDWGPVYCATKHAMLGYTRAWALPANFNQHGVRFNMVCPGNVSTAFEDFVRSGRVLHAEAKQKELATADSIPTSQIAEQFIRLIEDDSFNGTAVEILEPNKIRIVPFLTDEF